jgi:hypothetical protein
MDHQVQDAGDWASRRVLSTGQRLQDRSSRDCSVGRKQDPEVCLLMVPSLSAFEAERRAWLEAKTDQIGSARRRLREAAAVTARARAG